MNDILVLKKLADTIRSLTVEAVEKAKSGHPGLPMGCAELGALLYGSILRHYPLSPDWVARDRVVLSAGHGSMWLYSLLYLSGYRLSLADIQNFRQLHSKTPGHPELGTTEGVEATTGPLGQGLGMSVGMAMGQTRLVKYFGQGKNDSLFEHYTYVLASDGCIMEGITAEASSLAGHWRLGRLIVFYDSNGISIDGTTDMTFTEDVLMRYESYNWHVQKVDGHNINEIYKSIDKAKKETKKPSLIILKTTIAKGSPNKEGSHKTHGAPLGEEEVFLIKEQLGFPKEESFYVSKEVSSFMAMRLDEHKKDYHEWSLKFSRWAKDNPDLKKQWDALWNKQIPPINWNSVTKLKKENLSTRLANHLIMQDIADVYPFLWGGSADLASSNLTDIEGDDIYSFENCLGKNIRFGIREHAMGSIVNGLKIYAPWCVYGASFFVFSDYMRPAIRLSAIQKLPVIWIFSHDSFYVGEDGPTHQPIEQLESLRLIPNLNVARPADIEECQLAWELALKSEATPYIFVLTRQDIPSFLPKPKGWKEEAKNGAYILFDSNDPKVTIIASGSELHIALEVAKESNLSIRVISLWCKDLWDMHPEKQKQLLKGKVIVFEACSHSHFKADLWVDLVSFGESGKPRDIAYSLGMTKKDLQNSLININ